MALPQGRNPKKTRSKRWSGYTVSPQQRPRRRLLPDEHYMENERPDDFEEWLEETPDFEDWLGESYRPGEWLEREFLNRPSFEDRLLSYSRSSFLADGGGYDDYNPDIGNDFDDYAEC